MERTAWLVFLGVLWSLRLSAIKAAGLSGLPPHGLVAVATPGIALVLAAVAALRREAPPLEGPALTFYAVSGALGFLAPFVLEILVAPHLAVFLFVVIIATMPLFTLVLSVLSGAERLRAGPVAAVALGFAGAVAILWDTGRGGMGGGGAGWVMAAFGVPLLYALNTVFVASRWPAGAGAVPVALGQAVVVAAAAALGSLAAGAGDLWRSVLPGLPVVGVIALCEGLALVVYLRLSRDAGPTFVALANYVSMVAAAVLGALWFGDRLTLLTVAAAVPIAAAVMLCRPRRAA